ncbi:MAG: hypothetical protein HON65_05315 [Rhodospirillales bacterium]|nr:hypothetical protein [Rhodospirillales bacterium]
MVTIPEIREAAVFQINSGTGLKICTAIVLEGKDMPDALAQKVTEVLGELTPQRLEIVKKLPRNSMGKLMRHKLVERFSNKPVQSG